MQRRLHGGGVNARHWKDNRHRDAGYGPKPLAIATQTFAHIVLVGIPIALITARGLRARQT